MSLRKHCADYEPSTMTAVVYNRMGRVAMATINNASISDGLIFGDAAGALVGSGIALWGPVAAAGGIGEAFMGGLSAGASWQAGASGAFFAPKQPGGAPLVNCK